MQDHPERMTAKRARANKMKHKSIGKRSGTRRWTTDAARTSDSRAEQAVNWRQL